ncbi:protein phosphatase 1 regulatory subunit 14C [Pleuronectes platessa]|uniref:protein phosphatase 1 regulatory subunit 14C n=1 Tax=Pleuronectes platessa TaxID=8262 RepID=UPI00232A1708|nr:protein phosphatase 1 regulatory subunit 14C [Pleuronectes platessa]XP_062267996.1 protein phosphatase 1 regulatory subunit 14C [Platichthys flesus]
MSAASTETSAPLPTAGSRVFFQGASGVSCVGSGPITGDDPVQKRQGKVTVKYDRKELRKRLVLEEWIIEQLSELYDCEEEEMPEVEIDIDDLLDVTSDDERASKLLESLTDCYKPTEVFVRELLGRIRGMRKLSAPSKKGL